MFRADSLNCAKRSQKVSENLKVQSIKSIHYWTVIADH